ncbi:MAG: hypothetical protein H6Q51_2521 [Deltaproteobacteria bacterium]|nr:hypothetical protein [Deltaproteobacteria bacterium]
MTEETIGIGSRLGGFQIESELGRGGMGEGGDQGPLPEVVL